MAFAEGSTKRGAGTRGQGSGVRGQRSGVRKIEVQRIPFRNDNKMRPWVLRCAQDDKSCFDDSSKGKVGCQLKFQVRCESILEGSRMTLKPGPVGREMWAFSTMGGADSK